MKNLDNFDVIEDEREGVSLVSLKTGASYCLLEGKSFNGSTSSDLIFIMRCEETLGYTNLVDFFFGANDDAAEIAADCITAFEAGRKLDLQSDLI